MLLDLKEEQEAQSSHLLLCQRCAPSSTSPRDPCPNTSLPVVMPDPGVANSLCLVFTPCFAYALPHTMKSKPTVLQDLSIFLLTPASLPHCWLSSLWHACGCASCAQVLHLRAELCSLLASVFLCEIPKTDPIFGG